MKNVPCPLSAYFLTLYSSFILPRDITEDIIHAYHEVTDVHDVDLLIRTSGERRLSDFLLWQIGYSGINFEAKTFPDISLWDIFEKMVYFQTHSEHLKVLSSDLCPAVLCKH